MLHITIYKLPNMFTLCISIFYNKILVFVYCCLFVDVRVCFCLFLGAFLCWVYLCGLKFVLFCFVFVSNNFLNSSKQQQQR